MRSFSSVLQSITFSRKRRFSRKNPPPGCDRIPATRSLRKAAFPITVRRVSGDSASGVATTALSPRAIPPRGPAHEVLVDLVTACSLSWRIDHDQHVHRRGHGPGSELHALDLVVLPGGEVPHLLVLGGGMRCPCICSDRESRRMSGLRPTVFKKPCGAARPIPSRTSAAVSVSSTMGSARSVPRRRQYR
jgi:hypothetical protein